MSESRELVPQKKKIGVPAELGISDETINNMLKRQVADISDIFRFPKISMLKSGKFEITSNNEVVEEFKAIILYGRRMKGMWEEGNKAPICSSTDLLKGTTGESCISCKHNKYGSDSKGGKGKACKDMYRMYLMIENCEVPNQLTIPPTSLKNVSEYIQKLTSAKTPYSTVETKFEAHKVPGSYDYSVVIFEMIRYIERPELVKATIMFKSFQGAMDIDSIDEASYEVKEEGKEEDESLPNF